jgi:hypothetical protein
MSGDQDRTLWFQCLPHLRGAMQATTDPKGRKAWIDRCNTREDCVADAAGVCPEGYAIEYSGTAKQDPHATQTTMLFRCKGDSE